MEIPPLTRKELERLKPAFQSIFPSRTHPKSGEVADHIFAYLDEHLHWPSEGARQSYLKMQMHTIIGYFIPEANDNLFEVASTWFTIWHWLDDTFEHQRVESQDFTRIIHLLQGTVQPDKASSMERTIYDIHERCLNAGNDDARKLFCKVMDMTAVWLKVVFTHRAQKTPRVYETMNDWLAFRKAEIAAYLMWPFLRWVMLLDIPPEILSRPDVKALEELACVHGVYVNDLWSLRKELNDVQTKATLGIKLDCPNTVVFYASKNEIGLADAMKQLEAELLEIEHRFVETARKTVKAVAAEYEDKEVKLVEKYIYDGLQMFLPGNIAWSSQCGRYNDLDITVPLHYAKSDAEVLEGLMKEGHGSS